MSLLLSSSERGIFINWLKNEIYVTEGIVKEMKKISIPEIITKKYETDIVACRVVCRMLENTEEVTI